MRKGTKINYQFTEKGTRKTDRKMKGIPQITGD